MRAFAIAIAILTVGIALALSVLSARIRADVDGVTVSCASALTSAEMRGVPDDGALDSTQLGCRRAGRQRIHDGLPVAVSTVVIGFLATAAVIGASIMHQRSYYRLAQTVRP